MGWVITAAIAIVIIGLVVRQERRATTQRRGSFDDRPHTPDAPPGDGYQPPRHLGGV